MCNNYYTISINYFNYINKEPLEVLKDNNYTTDHYNLWHFIT